MKLEEKFINSFFYMFLLGVIINLIIATIFLYFFTNNYIDKKTGENIVILEKKYARINLNSVNALLSTTLLKVQESLNEQIIYYQKLANNIQNIVHYDINNFLHCVLDLDDDFLKKNYNSLQYMGVWFLNNETRKENLTDNNDTVKLQLITYSNILPNIHSTFSSIKSSIEIYSFYFEKTDLFITFPLEYYYNTGFLDIFKYYSNNPAWCLDSKGKPFHTYKFKCRDLYHNLQKAKSGIYDLNNIESGKRNIFISNSYNQFGLYNKSSTIFSIVIQFDDPITGDIGYALADVNQNDLLFAFDNFNAKLSGYYFITAVGFNNVFYYPQMDNSTKTPTENIFRWETKYFLKEKTYFINAIQKLLTSNYNSYINNGENSLFEEIRINGVNISEQYFYINGEKYFYSLLPVILENMKGSKEHVLSIIYLSNNQIYYNNLKAYLSNTFIKICLEVALFAVFGSGLLYLVILSFKNLAKFIVIPIKNINYMLKGIHIGGENRLEYLDYLKKRQNENLEKLEKITYNISQNNIKNEINYEKDNHLLNKEHKHDEKKHDSNNNYIISEETDITKANFLDQEKSNANNIEYNGELIDLKDNYNKKYDKESDYIEKEINFYDFDEELLQYRPLEIDNLVKSLLDLKKALLLTSTDQNVNELVNYSYSEEIFMNFKNKEGTNICQSNIGNLQSQLLKFDKAIYHIALSLQDDKLKRFLSKVLSDELDESDTLFNKISLSFNNDKEKEKINILAEKQQNNTHDKFSQKIIGVLINSRYCKLINAYFKFFSLVRKSNIELLNGQFMNTHLHTINYYHKILIQYIYLSYAKNDLIKIGESILDYIEFLIKFKFKTSLETAHYLNIRNKDRIEYKAKQEYKKKIFNKILNWINLFDDYVLHVRNNSTLGDKKSLVDDYSKRLKSSNNEIYSSSQSAFLFRINIQRGDFLKGKFALVCENYNDALFFFIRAAKKKSIVLDGLIQKKALKHIFKIYKKIYENLINYNLIDSYINQRLVEYQKTKNKNKKVSQFSLKSSTANIYDKNQIDKKIDTFKTEMDRIKTEINKDISECDIKQAKDILILIDFNTYDQESNNNIITKNKIENFIEQTKAILQSLLNNDRLGVFIYTKEYKIICPLKYKNEIDINNFFNDLIYNKKKFFGEIDQISIDDILINEKLEFQSNNDKYTEQRSEEDSIYENEIKSNNFERVSGLIESINYVMSYFKMKELTKNEKYIILFTDLFNYYSINEEEIKNNFENLKNNKDVNFILAGKNNMNLIQDDNIKLIEEQDEKKIFEILEDKFGEKSELIDFENMKRIQSILASNNVIKDEILFPNEIY